MKISKIVAIATLAVAAGQSFNAFAASSTGSACAGAAGSMAPFGNPGVSNADTNSFIKTGFSIQCSNNVIMSYNDISATLFGVVAGSVKGNQIVGGNSNGGAIRLVTTCPTTGCTDTLVNAELTNTIVTGGGS